MLRYVQRGVLAARRRERERERARREMRRDKDRNEKFEPRNKNKQFQNPRRQWNSQLGSGLFHSVEDVFWAAFICSPA